MADGLTQPYLNDDLQHGFGVASIIWRRDLVLVYQLEVDPTGGNFSFSAQRRAGAIEGFSSIP